MYVKLLVVVVAFLSCSLIQQLILVTRYTDD